MTVESRGLFRLAEWFTELDESALSLLARYHAELLKFNKRLNLISRNTERESDEIHIADSILAVRSLPPLPEGSIVYDMGSGNGLPGVVLAILNATVNVVAVDSDSRKCEFIKHVADGLSLSNLSVKNARVESLGEVHLAVTRGLASISKLLSVCEGGFPLGSRIFHLKGAQWETEMREIPSETAGKWSAEIISEYKLPVSMIQRVVVSTTRTS